MRFATIKDGSPDGLLHLVSKDNQRCAVCESAKTMQNMLEQWSFLRAELEQQYRQLNEGGGETFRPEQAMAPLPRAWQWLDASAFDSHGKLMDQAFKVSAQKIPGKPLMYQGMSHQFYGPEEPVPFPSEDDDIDFEGEFGLITTATPMGTKQAESHIALLVQINDWSLRKLAPAEMKTCFGWLHAKPACSMAPIALTPDELGSAWRDCRIDLPLSVEWNGKLFGTPGGYDMSFGLDQLVEHAAYSRVLPAGTVIGTGTVSNENCREVGSACIAEKRGAEIIDAGESSTPFMRFGDRVRMECVTSQGAPLFGAIDQQVVRVE